jgi:hypothetical protein
LLCSTVVVVNFLINVVTRREETCLVVKSFDI